MQLKIFKLMFISNINEKKCRKNDYDLVVRLVFNNLVKWLVSAYLFMSVCAEKEFTASDVWALDWIQRRAECIRFCLGQAVTPAGQLPVSSDIEYEFGTRNAYNFLQLTYYQVLPALSPHSDKDCRS